MIACGENERGRERERRGGERRAANRKTEREAVKEGKLGNLIFTQRSLPPSSIHDPSCPPHPSILSLSVGFALREVLFSKIKCKTPSGFAVFKI